MEWLIIIGLCLLAGLVLLMVEVFMPGFGIPGIGGILLLIGGIAAAWTHYGATVGMGVTLAVAALVAAAISIALKLVASGKFKREGLTLESSSVDVEKQEAVKEMQLFVGKEGRTKTALHPVGDAEFDCGKLNVISDDGYIEKDSPVRINRVEGTQIYVTRI